MLVIDRQCVGHFELFNALRRMTLGSDAVLTEPEANRLIASLEKEVELGCFLSGSDLSN
jgi:hypothetical protein